jgi:hypothetical protein
MVTLWKWEFKPSLNKSSILEKFQAALILAKHHKFVTNKPPYQAVNILIRLRNALVHYRPETFATTGPVDPKDKSEHEKLGKDLRSYLGARPSFVCKD